MDKALPRDSRGREQHKNLKPREQQQERPTESAESESVVFSQDGTRQILLELGVCRRDAVELSRTVPAQEVEAAIVAVKAYERNNVLRNPGGCVARAVRERWKLRGWRRRHNQPAAAEFKTPPVTERLWTDEELDRLADEHEAQQRAANLTKPKF